MNPDSLNAALRSEDTVLEFSRAPDGWERLLTVFVVLAAVYLVFWLYRREQRTGAPLALRLLLAFVRTVVLLAAVLIWLGPARATYITTRTPGHVAVLVDASASMSIRHAWEASDAAAMSRWAAVTAQLTAADAAWLRQLADRNILHLYAFGSATQPLALPWAPAGEEPALRDLRPSAARTDISQALATVLGELADVPLAAVVLLSDGAANSGSDADELASYVRRYRTPIHAVGVGDVSEPPNVRVANLSAPAVVARGDPFTLAVELTASGTAVRELPVTVSRVTESGGAAALATRQATLAAQDETPADADAAPRDTGAQRATLRFELPPGEPGATTYRVTVEQVPGDALPQDNAREATVTVLERPLRVLLVSGGPTYAYRFITPLFERDESIELSCWLQSAEARAVRDGDRRLDALPRDAEELFAYDAILLLDPDPAGFDANWALLVRRWVEEAGGGLLLQAGPHYTTRLLRDPRLADLTAVLPLVSEPEADLQLQQLGTYRTTPANLVLPESAAEHPVMSLQPDPLVNRQIWPALEGAWWYLPTRGPKAAATVLLTANDPVARGEAPLLALQPVGSGRTALLAFNSTWRWRATAEAYFNQFWINSVRYLAQARREAANPRGRIVLDRDTFTVDDYLRVEARRLDERYNPAVEEEVDATLHWSNGETLPFTLRSQPERPGWYAGRVLLDREGAARITVPLPGAGDGAAPQRLAARLTVRRPDVEMQTLRLHEEVLRTLAEETGGAYLRLADAGRLPERIRSADRRNAPQRAAADPLWDEPWVLLTLAGLLAGEWTLRRRNHLL